MNRPGYGCLTCPKDECDGCYKVRRTKEESAMLYCGIPRTRVRKEKKPEAAATAPSNAKKNLRAYCSTPTGGNAI